MDKAKEMFLEGLRSASTPGGILTLEMIQKSLKSQTISENYSVGQGAWKFRKNLRFHILYNANCEQVCNFIFYFDLYFF